MYNKVRHLLIIGRQSALTCFVFFTKGLLVDPIPMCYIMEGPSDLPFCLAVSGQWGCKLMFRWLGLFLPVGILVLLSECAWGSYCCQNLRHYHFPQDFALLSSVHTSVGSSAFILELGRWIVRTYIPRRLLAYVAWFTLGKRLMSLSSWQSRNTFDPEPVIYSEVHSKSFFS